MILVFFLFQMCFACGDSFDASYVRSKTWSYDGGFKVGKGDFIIFHNKEKLFDLKGDTIYYEGKPRAIVKSIDKSAFSMTVKSLDKKEIGTYIDLDAARE